MLDGLGYVMAQVAVVALLAAVLGGVLGWLIGRGRPRSQVSIDSRLSPAASGQAPKDRPAAATAQIPGIEHRDGLAPGVQPGPVVVAAESTGIEGRAPLDPRSEVAELRAKLDRKERELSRLETVAVTAWDRTVPQLERTVAALRLERDTATAEFKAATQALEVAGAEVERLRGAVAERDKQWSTPRPAGERE